MKIRYIYIVGVNDKFDLLPHLARIISKVYSDQIRVHNYFSSLNKTNLSPVSSFFNSGLSHQLTTRIILQYVHRDKTNVRGCRLLRWSTNAHGNPLYLAGLALHECLCLGQEVAEKEGVVQSIPNAGTQNIYGWNRNKCCGSGSKLDPYTSNLIRIHIPNMDTHRGWNRIN